MTTRKLGDTITKDFVTLNPSTGAAVDADSTPTAAVYEDDTDTGLSGITVTKRTGLTGDYRVAIAATAGNGFEVGKSYNVIVSATVDGVAAKACIFSFTLDSKRLADLNDIAAGAAMALTSAYDAAKTAASQTSVNALPTLAEIEASTVIAKETTAAEAVALLGKYALSNPTFDPATGNMLTATITTATKTYAITATYDLTTGNLLTYIIEEA